MKRDYFLSSIGGLLTGNFYGIRFLPSPCACEPSDCYGALTQPSCPVIRAIPSILGSLLLALVLLGQTAWAQEPRARSLADGAIAESVGLSHMTIPANLAIGVDPFAEFLWTATPGAAAYYVKIGSAPGVFDVMSSRAVVPPFTSIYPLGLIGGTTYYVTLFTELASGGWLSSATSFATAPQPAPVNRAVYWLDIETIVNSVRQMTVGASDTPIAGTLLAQWVALDAASSATSTEYARALEQMLFEQRISARIRHTSFDNPSGEGYALNEYYDLTLNQWVAADAHFGSVYLNTGAATGLSVDQLGAQVLLQNWATIYSSIVYVSSYGSQIYDNYYIDPLLLFLNPVPNAATPVVGATPNSPAIYLISQPAGIVGTAGNYIFSFLKSTDTVIIEDPLYGKLTIGPVPGIIYSRTTGLSAGWTIISRPAGMQILTDRQVMFPGELSQPLTVEASQTSATQAILNYTAPSPAACSAEVSESPAMTPLVHDVDPALFSGADSDQRIGGANAGLRRSFIVGTRRSDKAGDANFYSRALQSNTAHYYRLNCSGTIVSGQFTTQNPPPGNSYPEPIPYNANAWGHMAWPTIDWNNKAAEYIDPLTGILIKRLTGPGETYGSTRGYGYDFGPVPTAAWLTGNTNGVFSYVNDIDNAWTNANGVLGNSQSTTASYTRGGTDPLFVAWGASGMPEGFSPFTYNLNSIDNLQIAFFGTSPSSRQVQFCLSFYDSGATCNTPYRTVTLPHTAPKIAAAASAVFPSSTSGTYPSTPFPDGGQWAGWTFTSGSLPMRGDVSVYSGTFSASGSTVTNTAYQGEFNRNWKSGAKIYMAGTAPACPGNVCTVASVTNGNTLVIAQSLGPVSGSFYSLASGVVIRPVAGSGVLNLGVSSAYAQSANVINPNGGDNNLCSLKSVTVTYAADGVTPISPVQGELCEYFVQGNPGLWLFIPSTGESRFLSPLYLDNSASAAAVVDRTITNGYTAHWTNGSFDSADPNKLYIWFSYGGGPHPVGATYDEAANSIMTVTYQPSCNYKSYNHSLYSNVKYANGADTTKYWFQAPMWADTCLTYNSTKFAISNNTWLDHDVVDSPSWKPSMASSYGIGIGVAGIRDGAVLISSTPGGQDTANGLWIVNASTGALEFSGSSLGGAAGATEGYPLRWGVNHSTDVGTPPGTFGIEVNQADGNELNGMPSFTSYGRGPFVFQPATLLKGAVFSTDTSIPADSSILQACPTGLAANLVSQGASGNNCITFQSRMACSAVPYWPSPGNVTLNTPVPYPAAGDISTIPFSYFSSTAGIKAGMYLYVSNFNSRGSAGGPSEAQFKQYYPGYELIYVSTVNANSLTVVRGVNGVTGQTLPAYTNAAYPAALGPNTTGNAVGVVFLMTGLQSPEAKDWPCQYGPTDIAGLPLWSQPAQIQPGDLYTDWGQLNQWGEWEDWQIVSVTPLGGANYQFVASRSPTSQSNYCVLPGNIHAWPDQWSGYMLPPCGTDIISTADPSAGWDYEFVGIGHASFGFGGSSAYATITSASDSADPYTVWHGISVMSPANPFAENPLTYTTPSMVPFDGYSPSYNWQSYPSQTQFSSPNPSDSGWLVDFHALNPPAGNTQGQGNVLGNQNCGTGALVGGASTVWKWHCTYPYKVMPVFASAGPNVMREVSSPKQGNVIDDATPWEFCVAYASNECRSGSVSGDVYMAVPQAGGQTEGNLGTCVTNYFEEFVPCVLNLEYSGGAIVQGSILNTAVNTWRKLTNAFNLPGTQWAYSSATVDPTGQWAMFACDWCNGDRTDLYAAKLPSFPWNGPYDTNNFVPLTVTLGGSTEYGQARIRFGYVENGGNPANFYCTQRADQCMTSSVVTPFAFVSEGANWANCAAGCALTVPSLPGRVLFYVIDRRSSPSGPEITSEMRTFVSP